MGVAKFEEKELLSLILNEISRKQMGLEMSEKQKDDVYERLKMSVWSLNDLVMGNLNAFQDLKEFMIGIVREGSRSKLAEAVEKTRQRFERIYCKVKARVNEIVDESSMLERVSQEIEEKVEIPMVKIEVGDVVVDDKGSEGVVEGFTEEGLIKIKYPQVEEPIPLEKDRLKKIEKIK